MQKIITFLITIFIVGIILFGLGKQIVSAIESSKRLDSEAEEVNKLQVKNRQLKEKLAQTQRYEFVEQTARDNLNLAKKGETVVVVPDGLVDRVMISQVPVEEIKVSNFEGWMRLFFH